MNIFSRIKAFFVYTPAIDEAFARPMGFGNSGMLVDTTPTRGNRAVVEHMADGSANLYSPTGTFVGTYSRARDAVRGAKRRGWNA